MKTRIEVDEMGRHILILPDDIVEEWQLEDGDSCTCIIDELTGAVLINF